MPALLIVPFQSDAKRRAEFWYHYVSRCQLKWNAKFFRPGARTVNNLRNSTAVDFRSLSVVFANFIAAKNATLTIIFLFFCLKQLSSFFGRFKALLTILVVVKPLVFTLLFSKWHNEKSNVENLIVPFKFPHFQKGAL